MSIATPAELQSDLLSMGSALAALGPAFKSTDQPSTTLQAAGNAAVATGAVVNDIVQLASTNETLTAVTKVVPLAGIAAAALQVNTDIQAANANAAKNNGSYLISDLNQIALDSLNLGGQVSLLLIELGGVAEVAPEAAIAFAGLNALTSVGSTINSYFAEDPNEIVVNATHVTFSDGEYGTWFNTNGDSQTETFEVWNRSTGQLISSVAVPYGEQVTPSGSGFSFVSEGNTVNIDNNGNITVQTQNNGTLSPPPGGSISIQSNSIALVNPDGSASVYASDGNTDSLINLQDSSGNYTETWTLDNTATGASATQTDIFQGPNNFQSSTTTFGGQTFSSSNPDSGLTLNSSGGQAYQFATTASGQTFNASQLGAATIIDQGGSNTLTTGGASNVTLVGTNSDTLEGNNDGGTLIAAGTSITVDATGETVLGSIDANASVFGNSNTVTGNSGAGYGVYGQGNTINAGSDQYVVVGNTDNVFDTVNASNDDNSSINLNSGSQANISGSNDVIGFQSGDVAGIYGGGNSIYGNGGANEYIVVGNTDDNFDYVNVSGDVQGQSSSDGYGTGVTLDVNTQANVNGGDNYIYESAGDALGAYGGSETVAMGADEVLVVGNTNGDADTVNGTGDQIGQTAANGQTTGIFLNADSQAVVNGSRDGVQLAGSSDTLTAADDNVGIPQGLTNEVIDGSNEVIDIGKDVSVTIDGSYDTVHGATSDDLYFDGTHDLADVSDSTVDFTGSNTDDDVDGSGDKGSDWGGSSGSDGGEDGGDGGYGGYGGYAFSSAPTKSGTNIGLIASYDADLTDQAGAQTAETARLQAEASLSSTASSYAPVFEGAQWASKTITWSIADNPNNNGAQISGAIGSQYVSLIESAFQTWAAVSGLTFQQVTGSTTADIQLGWSSFNSASSGVLGYTGFTSMNGSILAGALISLENPADDALTTDANGQLAYTGAQTELEQLILHEIGHALGLADDSDPKSIMYAVLNAANRTLDATDVEGIQALYEPTTIAATTASATAAVTTGLSDIASLVSSSPITVASSLISSLTSSALSPFTTEADQLIDAMASFSPTASPTTFIPTTLASVASGLTLATAGG